MFLKITQTPLYGRVSVLGGVQNKPIGASLGMFNFVNGQVTVFLKANNPGTFTIAWSTPGGFHGTFTWSFSRRITFINNT